MRSRIVVLWVVSACLASSPLLANEILIGGRVLLPGGSPLAEAEVRLERLVDTRVEARDAFEGEPADPAALAVTDETGRFQLRAPAAGLWRVRVEVPGFVPMVTALRPLLETTELPDLELKADTGFQLRVQKPDGSPLTGARVRLETDRSRYDTGRGGGWSVSSRLGVTDDKGTLTLPRADRERTALSVAASGFAFRRERGLRGTAATLKLRRGKPVTIETVSSRGEPLAEVLVLLGNDPVPVGRTDGEGRLTLILAGTKSTPLALLAPDGRRAESRLAPGSQRYVIPNRTAVSGRLIDADTRRSIAGGVVWDSENPVDAAITDGAGGFVLAGPRGRRLQITAGAPGYLRSDQLEFQLNDDGRPGPTLILRPAAAIEGRVVDNDGQPVAGAELEVEVRRPSGMMRIEIGGPRHSPRAITDVRGAFRLSQLDPDNDYTLRVSAEEFAPASETLGGLEPYETKSGVRVVMSRGHSITGVVVDAEGRAVRDADVKAEVAAGGGHGMLQIGRESSGERFEATSDGEGAFALGGLPEGKFDLEVSRTGFARRKLPGVEPTDDEPVVDVGQIVLEPGERVQGMAMDDDGLPLEGVEVTVSEAGGMRFMMMGGGMGGQPADPDAVTDPGGWFEAEDLDRNAKYNFTFRHTGFVQRQVGPFELPRLEPIEVKLDPSSTVGGIVLDPEGEGVAGAEVHLRRSKTIEMGGAVMQTVMMESETTDGAGRFVFEDQEPGTISLKASATGFQEAKRDNIEIPKGEDVDGIELPLEPGAILEGRILAPDGRPAVGATVSEVREQQGMIPDFGGNASDGAGYFRIEGLAPGILSVEAKHPDYPRAVKDVEVRVGVNSVEMQFKGGQEVNGRVFNGSGEPVPFAAVRLSPAARYWGGPQTTTEADGSFAMPGVQDGDYRLWADAEGYAPSTGEQSVRVAGEPVSGIEVQLGSGGAVYGKISGIESERFTGVSVRADGRSFAGLGGVPVDHEGNYRVENLLPGNYNMIAELSTSGRQARGQTTLAEGEAEIRLDLQFGTGLTLSGRAVQTEEPISGATVYVSGVDIDLSGWGQTDTDGAFSIDGLEAGSYRVQLQHFQTGLTYTENVELATSREIVLDVPTGEISGRVVDSADRQPLAGVVVKLSPATEEAGGFRMPRSTTTDMTGGFWLDNVPDGDWQLNASKQGYAAVNRSLAVQFERAGESLNLSMDPTEGLTLETRLPSGAIPEEVRVAVVDAGGSPVTAGNYATGENGRVRLSTVPPGSWELIVSGAGSAVTRLSASSPGAVVPVALQPACELAVKVPELSETSAIATVRLQDAQGRPFRSLSWLGSPQSEWRMTQGELRLRSLPPGTWNVTVTTADGRSWQGSQSTAPNAPAELKLN